jgi:molecular chaperone DnaK (HSP70)
MYLRLLTPSLTSAVTQVPAIWKDGAKEKTRRCAREAGMGENVKIITEPEAAAIHALDMMDPHGLEIGQAFIVCDCGGGTVGKGSLEPILDLLG